MTRNLRSILLSCTIALLQLNLVPLPVQAEDADQEKKGNWAYNLISIGEIDSAEVLLTELLKPLNDQHKGSVLHWWQAIAYVSKGHLQQAADILDKQLGFLLKNRVPETPGGDIQKTRLMLQWCRNPRERTPDDLIADVERYQRISGNNESGFALFAIAFLNSTGECDKADLVAQMTIGDAPVIKNRNVRVNQLLRRQRFAEAATVLNPVVEKDKNDNKGSIADLQRARLFRSLGKVTAAYKDWAHFDKCDDAQNGDNLLSREWVHSQKERLALELCEMARKDYQAEAPTLLDAIKIDQPDLLLKIADQSMAQKDYSFAFNALIRYTGDSNRLSEFCQSNLARAAMNEMPEQTALNLVAAAVQTNIAGDTSRAQSLAKAATSLLKPMNNRDEKQFCISKLSPILPGSQEDKTLVSSSAPESNNVPQRVSSNHAPIRDKWALIVGISNFKNPQYNLKVAAKDAQDFYNYLINEANFRKDHVLLLLNERATRENIMTAFGDQFLPAVSEPGDLVVVYVSTHGTPKNKDKAGRNYIVAHDTDASRLYATGVDMDELNKRIVEGVKTDRALVIMDTCYSGAGVPGARAIHEADNFDANYIAQGCGHLVISSSSPNEKSWESKVSPNGVFTKYLIEELRKSKTKIVKSTFADVQKKVAWEVKSVFGEHQTPQLGGNWEGNDLILSLPPTEPRPVLNPDLLKFIQSPQTHPTPTQRPGPRR